MNKPISATSLQPSDRLDSQSPDIDALLSRIAEGAAHRERERILPFAEVDLIRKARLGALRLPADVGGAGASIRTLFELVIRLGAADANVAHILRNHFSVVERLVRRPRDEQHAAMAEGRRRRRDHRARGHRTRYPEGRQCHAEHHTDRRRRRLST
ncbi:alkylation response protein AidB-like acyl-CoA dehydrogenase [Bradyrhizobium sp. USDA 4341]